MNTQNIEQETPIISIDQQQEIVVDLFKTENTVLSSLHTYVQSNNDKLVSCIMQELQDTNQAFYADTFPNVSEIDPVLSLNDTPNMSWCIQNRRQSLLDLILGEPEAVQTHQTNAAAFINAVHKAFSVPASEEQMLQRIEKMTPILKEVFPGLTNLSQDIRRVFLLEVVHFFGPQSPSSHQNQIDGFFNLVRDDNISMATRTAVIKISSDLPINNIVRSATEWLKMDNEIEKKDRYLQFLLRHRVRQDELQELGQRVQETKDKILELEQNRETFLIQLAGSGVESNQHLPPVIAPSVLESCSIDEQLFNLAVSVNKALMLKEVLMIFLIVWYVYTYYRKLVFFSSLYEKIPNKKNLLLTAW